jgi:hypothetical protein
LTFQGIADSWLLTFTYTDDQWPEVSSFGMHTGARDPDAYEDVLDWMENFLADVATPIMAAATASRVSISNWTEGPGFTGYHLLVARDIALGFGSGNPAPHQCALAVGYRNTANSEVALGRRRNRFYLGPIKASIIQSDSRLSSGLQGSLSTTLAGQVDDLDAITPSSGLEDFGKLCPVSPTHGFMFSPDQYSMGRRFDVIRSRAEHVPESVLYTPV